MHASVYWFCLLITGYFFCLPLGRFNFAGFDSDFRAFDFIIVVFWLFNWNYLIRRIKYIHQHKRLATHFLKILMIIVLVSLIFNISYRGLGYLGPTLIRFFRFIFYLLTLVAFIAVVDSRKKFRLVLLVFFGNILVQAVLAFLQGIEVLGHFWPDYWREMYGYNDAPVATLSPHHKHIGVVMLMGFALAFGLVQSYRNIVMKIFFATAGAVMLVIPLFSGTRTFLLGLAGVVLALIWISKGRVLPIMIFFGFGLLIFSMNVSDEIKEKAYEKISEKYEERVVREYEAGGIQELASERTVIYESIFRSLGRFPFLLITGAGFQAGSVFVFGNGAHNNFLQFLIETGLVGLFFFLAFLYQTHKNLRQAARYNFFRFERTISQFIWVGFVGLFFTMFVGETLYAQASMFTLSGQIMIFLGLGLAPYFWQSVTNDDGLPFYR